MRGFWRKTKLSAKDNCKKSILAFRREKCPKIEQAKAKRKGMGKMVSTTSK